MSEVSTQPQLMAPPGPGAPAAIATRRHSALDTVQSLATTIAIAVFVITFIVQAFTIPSESMEKTLLVGDYLLVDKVHYGSARLWRWLLPYEPVRRQDIIVFRYPVNPQQHFVKRVVALPGDRVRLVNKHVYVNGVPLPDSYATFNWSQRDPFRDNFPDGGFLAPGMQPDWYLEVPKMTEDKELIVPEGSYFVLGDNRDDSYDSRYWGFVPAENVVGRPLLIYWSMDRVSAFGEGYPPSGKLSSLASNVARLLESLRWHRMMRIPH